MQKTKSIHNAEYNNFIKQLVRERKRLKLSQSDVAVQLQMTQPDISKIENNERRLDVLELRNLVSIYDINKNVELKEGFKSFFHLID